MVLGASPLAERSVGESGRDVKLLPYHTFEIRTMMRPDAAREALAAHTEERRFFRLRFPGAGADSRFEGEVSASGFNITRVIGYRNSFLPLVEGDISADAGGSLIRVRMRPMTFVIVFLFAFGIIPLSLLPSAFSQGGLATATFPFFFVAFAYAMSMGGFWFEASKQERVLREIFQAL
jgi:hypothetical protein